MADREVRFKREYTALWAGWGAWGVTMELVGVHADNWLWLAWMIVLGAIEAGSQVRRKEGDSLSEHMWWWSGGRVARRSQTVTFGLWLSWHFYGITPGPLPCWHAAVGPALLTMILAVWLPPHFFFEGEKG